MKTYKELKRVPQVVSDTLKAIINVDHTETCIDFLATQIAKIGDKYNDGVCSCNYVISKEINSMANGIPQTPFLKWTMTVVESWDYDTTETYIIKGQFYAELSPEFKICFKVQVLTDAVPPITKHLIIDEFNENSPAKDICLMETIFNAVEYIRRTECNDADYTKELTEYQEYLDNVGSIVSVELAKHIKAFLEERYDDMTQDFDNFQYSKYSEEDECIYPTV